MVRPTLISVPLLRVIGMWRLLSCVAFTGNFAHVRIPMRRPVPTHDGDCLFMKIQHFRAGISYRSGQTSSKSSFRSEAQSPKPELNAAHTTSAVPSDTDTYSYRVYLAVGSNLGDRYHNIRTALRLLSLDDDNIRVVRTSFLYDTEPMYVTDQPAFLNGAVEIATNFDPFVLLSKIKHVEQQLGRDFSTVRNGPRPVDLDILSCTILDRDIQNEKQVTMDTQELTIPHPRIHERDFVLTPFIDVAGPFLILPGTNGTLAEALLRLQNTARANCDANSSAVRVLPLPRGRLLYFNETCIMGILNVTPDSFSDGGLWTASVDVAVSRALTMEREGAAIIDIGGESTRPGALETSIDEQLRRVIPIIEGIRRGA
jgi:2-amino-4-hydroxy-6-hydroxymethyldihydropteridine diphosphokinase